MKALAIQQPWAWAILHAGKDIENRSWSTNYRGRFLIHASQGFDEEGFTFLRIRLGAAVPIRNDFARGGIIGSAVIRDCIRASDSPWFFGPYGFVLQGAQELPFAPCRGQLGFFEPQYRTPEYARVMQAAIEQRERAG
jgi:hypothetical protein